MRIAIAIPVYKAVPTADELLSLRQCISVLGSHQLFLVCPEGLDTSAYDEAQEQQQTQGRTAADRLQRLTFAPCYFESIDGYNRLMMEHHFYKRFSDYDYMLVYQLDAWVFTDELAIWCQRGYDYVGAPWFELNHTHEEGYELWCVGNGGLSLRKVSTFLRVTRLRPFSKVKSCRQVFSQEYHSPHDLGHCLVRCLGPLIGTNSIRHLQKRLQEDFYFCYGLKGSDHELHIPTPAEAALFAFECSPKYLYEEVTHGRLPFGCHAWRKHQYEEFWQQFILSGNDTKGTLRRP